jgi:AcrR family transcriptional regulator
VAKEVVAGTGQRADALRNRDKILTAARAAFADTGSDISMAEIARQSGVGMATLYRNFPGRRELLEALYANEVQAVCAAAADQLGDPGQSLATWLRRFFVFVTNKQPIGAELLRHSDGPLPMMSESRTRVSDAARPLITAAQQAGQLRLDLSLDQILDLIVAVASIPRDIEYLSPLLEATLNGITPPQPN